MTTPAGIEVFANQPTGTVTSGGTAATTGSQSFTVTAVNAFPVASSSTLPATWFRIMDPALPTEIMIVTTAPGGTGAGQAWTVTRAAEGTSAVAHAASWTAVQIVSAGTLQQIKQASQASTTAVTITTATTLTVLASYQPLASELVPGVTFAAVAYGPVTAHGGANKSTLAFSLYWGGSGTVGGAYTPGTLLATLLTGGNATAFTATTTMIAGASFDVNGEVTWLSATTAHANLNTWLAVGAALTTAPLVGTTTDSSAASGVSNPGPIPISGSGPIFLTAQFGGTGWTVYGLTAVSPVIYRVA